MPSPEKQSSSYLTEKRRVVAEALEGVRRMIAGDAGFEIKEVEVQQRFDDDGAYVLEIRIRPEQIVVREAV